MFLLFKHFYLKIKPRLNKKIEDIYNEQSKVKLEDNIKYLTLDVSGDIGDATALMPAFRYVFKE